MMAPALQRIRLRQFTVFEDLQVELVPGVNLFIGPNSSGKTHVLKAIFALLHAQRQGSEDPLALAFKLASKFAEVFLPADEHLVRLRRYGSTEPTRIDATLSTAALSAVIDARGNLAAPYPVSPIECALFVPTRDVLAMFEGFIAAYLKQKIAFDSTYFELCVALSAAPLRDGPTPALQAVVEQIEQTLGGKVELRGNRFYVVRQTGQDIEAHLLAEGHRKLASLVQLIRNGSIAPGTILFWDEPEANLNPKLIKPMADILRQLAAANVQILLATHDYLLSHELSMAAKFQTEPRVPMRFFSLYREIEPDGPVLVESGDTLTDLDHNPILDEYAALYDRESRLFAQVARRP